MSKLVSEADRLLEKGKFPEAIAKLQAALNAEPLNQLVATKLANVYVESGEPEKAAKVFTALAARLSDAGKAQVAIAIYKQALDLSPEDVELKVKYAIECEVVGKVGDAQTQGQLALQHYLRRKKFFDANNILPLLVRTQPKEEKLKLAWAEILQLSQAEQKLAHFLVAVCGPPGLASQKFPVGGEPTAMSEALYEALKRMVPFFPRDPKVAYAVAWAAHRRGREQDFYTFLRECLRREPDFCLALLLYARVFAEKQRLNESLFIYKYLKERIANDKSVDMLTLSRLVEGFVEKNGWITFTEGMGVEELDAGAFLRSVKGEAGSGTAAEAGSPEESSHEPSPGSGIEAGPAKSSAPKKASEEGEVPAEIELSLGESSSSEEDLELLLTTHQGKSSSPPVKDPAKPAPAKAAEPAPEAPPAKVEEAAPEPESPLRESTSTVELTSVISAPVKEEPVVEAAQEQPEPPAPEQEAAQEAKTAEPEPSPGSVPEPEEKKPAKKTFNPLEALNASQEGAAQGSSVDSDKTQVFSPLDLLGAANILGSEISKVQTKAVLQSQDELFRKDEAKASEPVPAPEAAPEPDVAPGEMLSPADAVQAAFEQRMKEFPLSKEADASASAPELAGLSSTKSEVFGDQQLPPLTGEPDLPEGLPSKLTQSEAVSMTASEVFTDPLDALANADGEATMFIPRGALSEGGAEIPDPGFLEELPAENSDEGENATMVFRPQEEIAEEPVFAGRPAVKFEKIPELSSRPEVKSPPHQEGEEVVDLGDDLLEGPTRVVFESNEGAGTAHLFKEIKKDIKETGKDAPSRMEYMLKKAERFIAKRNYYLARKALRHSLALGADAEKVKERLREIRKLEFPDSLYNAMSSDEVSREASEKILHRLEQEFDLQEEMDERLDGKSLSDSIESQIDAIFQENDSRTILDFGIAIHEMGLYRQAEAIFSRMVDEFPETAFDAYYLAAISKFSRKDYAGAASILKKLSADGGKPEIQKIQIYYALGELFEKMQRPERSREFFRKVAELDSNYRNIRHKLEE